jgi:hypothetical protein
MSSKRKAKTWEERKAETLSTFAAKTAYAEAKVFDDERMTHWGRRLFDSYHEATKSICKNSRSDHEPQDPPKSGNIEVTPEVIADLRARSGMGMAKSLSDALGEGERKCSDCGEPLGPMDGDSVCRYCGL